MAKIYTKTGDDGTTGLYGGGRVPKTDARIEAYGQVDELNACLGLVLAWSKPESPWFELLEQIQRDLFDIGAELASPDPVQSKTVWEGSARIAALEAAIDERQAELPPLKAFVLPGGTPVAAGLHLARTVCRRAERRVVQFATCSPRRPDQILVYLNRLSDLLFVLARQANHRVGRAETLWHPTSR